MLFPAATICPKIQLHYSYIWLLIVAFTAFWKIITETNQLQASVIDSKSSSLVKNLWTSEVEE